MTTRTLDQRAPNGNGWFNYVNLLTASGADTPAGTPLRENNYSRFQLNGIYADGTFTSAFDGSVTPVSGNVLFENCYPGGGAWSGGFWSGRNQLVPINAEKQEMDRRLLAGRSRLLEQVRGHNWNAAIDLAQVRQIAGLGTRILHATANTASALRTKGLRRIIRGDNRRLVWNDISRLWLEYVYGIRPTLSSIYGIADVVTGSIRKPKPARFETHLGQYEVLLMSRWCTGVYLRGRGATISSRKLIWKVPVTFPGLEVQDSLGLTNPALVVWDKIPFSFVVDWFVPIGSFLELRHLLPKIEGTEVMTTKIDSHLTDWTLLEGYYDDQLILKGYFSSEGKNDVRQFSFERLCRPISTVGAQLPLVEIKLPEGYRFASALALASLAVEKLQKLRP